MASASAEITGSIRKKMTISRPNDTKDLHALVDMGSNGIRFSISDLACPRSRLLPCIYRERASISLYDDLSASQARNPHALAPSFSPETILQVAQTVKRFKAICSQYFVPKDNIIIFATEAMRKASNKDDMLQAVYKETEWSIDILEGPMESLFGAMGARSGFEHVDGLFMDLGGGSVQMTYMNSRDENYGHKCIEAAKSLPYGAARLRAHLQDFSSSQIDALKKGMKKDMKETFEAVKQQNPQLEAQLNGDGVTIYFCGGGFRGYGSMLMHSDSIQPYPIPAIGGYAAPEHRFRDYKSVRQAHKDAKGKKIFGMSKSRREQLEGTLLVIKAITKAVPKIKEVIFCSGGNREGLLFMKLPTKIRSESPLALLPGGIKCHYTALEAAADTLASLLVIPGMPIKDIPGDLLEYVVKCMYEGMGDSDDINSAKALHSPTSGPLAGLPGFTHRVRAMFALIMCARWGTDIGRVDRELHLNLEKLVGPDISFVCRYIGGGARLMATVMPACPKGVNKSLEFQVMPGHSESGKRAFDVYAKVKFGVLDSLNPVKLSRMLSDASSPDSWIVTGHVLSMLPEDTKIGNKDSQDPEPTSSPESAKLSLSKPSSPCKTSEK